MAIRPSRAILCGTPRCWPHRAIATVAAMMASLLCGALGLAKSDMRPVLVIAVAPVETTALSALDERLSRVLDTYLRDFTINVLAVAALPVDTDNAQSWLTTMHAGQTSDFWIWIARQSVAQGQVTVFVADVRADPRYLVSHELIPLKYRRFVWCGTTSSTTSTAQLHLCVVVPNLGPGGRPGFRGRAPCRKRGSLVSSAQEHSALP